MLDGADVVKKVQAGIVPADWSVIRVDGRRFLAYAALIAFALYAIINDLSSKASVLAKYAPVPTLSWEVPFGSGVVVLAVTFMIAAVALFAVYQRARSRVLVLLPAGIVQGNVRTGQVQRAIAYADCSELRLITATEQTFELVPRVRLAVAYGERGSDVWPLEDYLRVPAGQIAQGMIVAYYRQRPPVAPVQPLPAPQALTYALDGKGQKGTWIFTPKLPLGWYQRAILLLGIAGLFYGVMINAYFIAGPTLPQRFNSGRPLGDVLASELVTLFAILAISVLFFVLGRSLYRAFVIGHTITVVTQSSCIVGWRKRGTVAKEIPFVEMVAIKVRHFFKSYTIEYTNARGKRGMIFVPAFLYHDPAKVCQIIVERWAQRR